MTTLKGVMLTVAVLGLLLGIGLSVFGTTPFYRAIGIVLAFANLLNIVMWRR